MLGKENTEKFFFILFSILPISIIVGTSVMTINILLICVLFLLFFFSKLNIVNFNHYSLISLIIIFFYLIINSIISIDIENSLIRNIGFIRFIILFICINFFYLNFKNSFLNFWMIIILLTTFDVYFEFVFGQNIFGWGKKTIDGVMQPNGSRIMSFFKDEPISGAFLSGFIFIIFGNLMNKVSKNKMIPLTIGSIIFIAIFLTGERSNTIRVFFGFLIFLFLVDKFDFKTKFLFFLLSFLMISVFISNNSFLKNRYVSLSKNFDSKEKIIHQYENNLYFKIYKSSYYIFTSKPLFGVGNKNYRLKSCEFVYDLELSPEIRNRYICTTHPHQIYFEFLSEHGIVGLLFLTFLFFFILLRVFKEILKTKNTLQIGCFVFVLSTFLPILPSGSFFSNFNSTIFWINFSLMFACNKNTNIFAINRIKN